MSPHTGRNGVAKARNVIILVAGVFVAIVGLAAGTVVVMRKLYPVAGHPQEFDKGFFFICVVIFAAGIMLVFYGDPGKVLKIARSTIPGGQRWYDPPPDTAPEYTEPEKWPKPPERKPRVPHPPRGD